METGTARLRKSPQRTCDSLSPKWIHSVRGFDNEMTPLVLDGIMYITATNQVSALDAATGREIWRFSRPRSTGLRGDAAIGFNRGVAVLGSRVFPRHRQRASRLRSAGSTARCCGKSCFRRTRRCPTAAPWRRSSSAISSSPACRAVTKAFAGSLRRTASTPESRPGVSGPCPRRGEPASETWKGSADLEKGGGATWLTGSYDAETDTLFWPTGNPYPGH